MLTHLPFKNAKEFSSNRKKMMNHFLIYQGKRERTEIWGHEKDYPSHEFCKSDFMIETNILMPSYSQDNARSGEGKEK